MQVKFTGPAPTPFKQHSAGDGGNVLFRDSLSQSASNVIGRAFSSVGLNYEKSFSVDECMICLEAMDEEEGNLFTVPGCSHTFHKTCLAQWKKQSRKCPCCRGLLPDDIGPTISGIRNLPAENVLLDSHESATCLNLIFCPLCVVYPLFLLGCFIAYMSVASFMFLLLTFWMAIYESVQEERNICTIVCVLIAACILFPVLLGFMYLIIILQILYMLFRIIKFYALVSMCKIRWIDAYSFIVKRTISLAGFYFDQLF